MTNQHADGAGKSLKTHTVPISALKSATYNPRRWSKSAMEQLKESIRRFGIVDPLIANAAPKRKNILIGGHFRLAAAKELGFKEVPVVYLNIPDIKKEQELNVRLNKNTGEFDYELLAEFDEAFLGDVGFSSEELDDIFPAEENPEVFDLKKELAKLDIDKVTMKKGDCWRLGDHRLLVGDSTIENDMRTLMGQEQADMVLTDPPYILDYLKGKKKKGDATTGFGHKRDRRYLETESLPDDFTERWMANVKTVAKDDFSIIVYENWKNIPTIWQETAKHWRIRNMLVWHLPNRVQGFAAKYKFFSKYDIAVVGSSGTVPYNHDLEEGSLQEEYETALFATAGKPHWEGYEKGKRIQPTDFIEYRAADEKSSGQGIIFGTKPVEILIPYLKVLTKRGGIVLEPFGGSGSTLIAAEKLKRRCRLMEKSPVYATVIVKRWEKLTGQKAEQISCGVRRG